MTQASCRDPAASPAFTADCKFASVASRLPETFLAGDSQTVLTTIAFLLAQPYAGHVNTCQQAMTVQLALYAAGAQVFLDQEQFRRVDAEAREFQALALRAPRHYGGEGLAQLVRYVRQHAATQHHLYGLHAGGKSGVDLRTGAGFKAVGTSLPESFLRWAPNCVLITIAFLYTHPEMRTSQHCQAVALLALYATGSQVKITAQQFRSLRDVVQDYESIMGGIGLPRNCQFASFARTRAEDRARIEGIF